MIKTQRKSIPSKRIKKRRWRIPEASWAIIVSSRTLKNTQTYLVVGWDLSFYLFLDTFPNVFIYFLSYFSILSGPE